MARRGRRQRSFSRRFFKYNGSLLYRLYGIRTKARCTSPFNMKLKGAFFASHLAEASATRSFLLTSK